MRIIVFYWRAAFGPFGYRVVLCPSIVFRGAPLGRNPSFLLEAQKCRVNCTFIQAEYITYKILPTERCFRRDACLLRRPKKVSADGHTFSADPRVFCSAALKREQFRKPKFKLQPKG